MSKVNFYIVVLVGIVISISCQSSKPLPTNNLIINGKAITVEIATTSETRMKGLMEREELARDAGMLFIFAQEDHQRFWMKDTLIPLSIAFIKTDGTISQIKPMEPKSEVSVWSLDRVKYALEMNQDWFERNNVKVGDKILFPEEIHIIRVVE